jgi:hypothetical protein
VEILIRKLIEIHNIIIESKYPVPAIPVKTCVPEHKRARNTIWNPRTFVSQEFKIRD